MRRASKQVPLNRITRDCFIVANTEEPALSGRKEAIRSVMQTFLECFGRMTVLCVQSSADGLSSFRPSQCFAKRQLRGLSCLYLADQKSLGHMGDLPYVRQCCT